MQKLFCPSMMCADFIKIKDEVTALDAADVDVYHMDIMDGNFVPNMALSVEDYKAIRSLTQKPLDAHLMVQDPKRYVELYAELGANTIYIHPEADQSPSSTLKTIRDLNVYPGIAINPGTAVGTIKPLLNLVDTVLVMTVNPGFSGQKYLDFVNDKIDELVKLQETYSYKIFVDGAIAPDKIQMLSARGVNGFILGTSSLFDKGGDYTTIIQRLRQL
ncbi:MAG: ribulose-phosphate 3-epimerase [Sporolactobacillus sp.]